MLASSVFGIRLDLRAFLRVTPRRRLDRLAPAAAQLLARGNHLAAVGLEPFGPIAPPAPRQLLRILEPLLGALAEVVVHPVAALVLRRGVDGARDVARGAQDELHLPAQGARAGIAALPPPDVG